jgi:hypothetical protein
MGVIENRKTELAPIFLKSLSIDRLEDQFQFNMICSAFGKTFDYSLSGLTTLYETLINNFGINFKLPFQGDQSLVAYCTKWYRKEDLPYTFRTIAYMYSIDNPEEYKSFLKESLRDIFEEVVRGLEMGLVEYIREMLWLHIISDNNGTGYFYNDDGWILDINHQYIIRYIKHHIDPMLVNIIENINEKIKDTQKSCDGDRKEIIGSLNALISSINKTRNGINKVATIKNIAKMVYVTIKENDVKLLNKNKNLTGVPNGVIDVNLVSHQINLRDCYPEDYIGLRTNTRVNLDLTWHSDKVLLLIRWFQLIFPSHEMMHWFLKYLSSHLYGMNIDKMVIGFSGESGNNGKSTIVRLIKHTFGDYAIKSKITILTKSLPDSSKPSPEWCQLSGPRFSLMEEPEEDVIFQTGPFKQISGNDSYSARNLYSNGETYEPTAKITISMNRITPFHGGDEAVKRRFKIIPFLSQWIDSPPSDPEEQRKERIYKSDPEFISRVSELDEALLWICFQYFPFWSKEKLEDIPLTMKEAIDCYWADNCPFTIFKDLKITKSSPNAKLKVSDAYDEFCMWFGSRYKNHQVCDMGTFKYHLSQLLNKKTRNGCWSGWTMFSGEIIPEEETENERVEELGSISTSGLIGSSDYPFAKFITDNYNGRVNKIDQNPFDEFINEINQTLY